MKKIFLMIISLMIILPVELPAQITAKKKELPYELTTVGMRGVRLMSFRNDIYISAPSLNRFDDYYMIELGDSMSKAIESVNSLIEILDSIKENDCYEITSFGKIINICRGIYSGTIMFKADGYADFGNLTRHELKQILKYLKSYK